MNINFSFIEKLNLDDYTSDIVDIISSGYEYMGDLWRGQLFGASAMLKNYKNDSIAVLISMSDKKLNAKLLLENLGINVNHNSKLNDFIELFGDIYKTKQYRHGTISYTFSFENQDLSWICFTINETGLCFVEVFVHGLVTV